jgi:hypothetical protein
MPVLLRRRSQPHLEQQLNVQSICDPHQRVKLGWPATAFETGDGRLGGAAQHRQLLLGHPPREPIFGHHPADVRKPLLMVTPEHLGPLVGCPPALGWLRPHRAPVGRPACALAQKKKAQGAFPYPDFNPTQPDLSKLPRIALSEARTVKIYPDQ